MHCNRVFASWHYVIIVAKDSLIILGGCCRLDDLELMEIVEYR